MSKKTERLRVMVRIKPEFQKPISESEKIYQVLNDNTRIEIQDPNYKGAFSTHQSSFLYSHSFTFDQVLNTDSTQEEVFEQTAAKSVSQVIQGYNSTVLAYGQTGTGKTYTIEGKVNSKDKENRGIIARSVEKIFDTFKERDASYEKVIVRVSYLQIYNEQISDLIKNKRMNLAIREDKSRGFFVENLSEWIITDISQMKKILKQGSSVRKTANTKLNNVSSRSHAVFIVTVEQMMRSPKNNALSSKISKLNLIDLAGSERIKITDAKGHRLEECKKINQSLSCLGKVISFLAEGGKQHIPYRESKLTRLLEDSLGGNCITSFLATVSEKPENYEETLNTLKFANQAKKIKNRPIINERTDEKSLLLKYEKELNRLKTELDYKNQMLNEYRIAMKNNQVINFDNIQELEDRNKTYRREMEEKKQIKQKINYLEKQVIQKQPTYEYEEKEDRSDEYQNLLLQQRDIIYQLQDRLKKRDEQINSQQQELETYEQMIGDAEDLIQAKNQRVEQLENFIQSKKLKLPTFKFDQKEINLSESENDEDFEYFEQMVGGQQNNEEFRKTLQNMKFDYQQQIEQLNKEHNFQQDKLKEKILENEIKTKQISAQMTEELKSTSDQFKNEVKNLKLKIDKIIQDLSQECTSKTLHFVAQDLINLHLFIDKMSNTYHLEKNKIQKIKKKKTKENKQPVQKYKPSSVLQNYTNN